jgi:glucose-6-phosphate dehydrogenase assembly protein OpcA
MNFDPERIEAELAEIQKKSSPTEARTVILNLLVISEEDSRNDAERALGAVLGKRAARVLHIVETESAESDISLSARCYLDYERKSVCFQEVLIESGADGVGDAPGSWTPLLIRDIPVYVLWLARFSGRRTLLDHVQEQADKLIIDSEYALSAGDSAEDVHKAITGVMRPEGFGVSDVTWNRMLPLRRATAHVFDQEDLARELFEIEALELSGTPPMFGALYLAWFATRLGWKPAAAGDGGAGRNMAAGDGGDTGAPAAGDGGSDAAAPPQEAGRDDPAQLLSREFTDQQGRSVRASQRRTSALGDGLSLTMRFFDRDPLELRTRSDGCFEVVGDQRGGDGSGERSDGREEAQVREIVSIPSDGEMLLAEIDAARSEEIYISAFDLIVE